MKETAQRVLRETLAAIDIHATLERKLECDGHRIRVDKKGIDLTEFPEILAIAIGKAAFPMADGLLRALPTGAVKDGILAAPAQPPRELPGWKTFVGGHPIPSAESFAAGRAILERL